ncbi:MAG TPA: hypothetical protein VIU12_31465 [Chryseolinea sp.]
METISGYKSMRGLVFAIGLTFLGLFNCGSKHSLSGFPDPYMDSFRGQKIKFMIAYDPLNSGIADTTVFDETGNDVRFYGYGRMQQRILYDSLHFIKRQLILNDIPENDVYEYSFDQNGILIQECREIEHLNWELKKSDKSKHVRSVFFEINEQGQVIKEIDTTSHQISVYKYGEHGNLLSRESLLQDLKPSGFISEYEYYEPVKLKVFRRRDGERKIIEQFFSIQGVLDSTVQYEDYGKRSFVIRYKYVYY